MTGPALEAVTERRNACTTPAPLFRGPLGVFGTLQGPFQASASRLAPATASLNEVVWVLKYWGPLLFTIRCMDCEWMAKIR